MYQRLTSRWSHFCFFKCIAPQNEKYFAIIKSVASIKIAGRSDFRPPLLVKILESWDLKGNFLSLSLKDFLYHCAWNRSHTWLIPLELSSSEEAMVLYLSWFVAAFQRLSTLVAPCSSIGFCDITAKLFSKGLCWWPRRTAPLPPRWPRVPVKKPWSKWCCL